MSKSQNAVSTPPSKRPRGTSELHQSHPLKRFKSDQDSVATPTETIVKYDACPTPSVVDFFYEDLIPKSPELSQLFPNLCHDAYVVRRWLGSAGCAIYWRMVMEGVEKPTDALNSPHHLARLIARSLEKLRGPQKEANSPKFSALCEILRLHLRISDASKITVFGMSREPDFSLEANSRQYVMTRSHELLCRC